MDGRGRRSITAAASTGREVFGLHPQPRRVMATVLVVGALAGVLEAGVLAVFMGAALELVGSGNPPAVPVLRDLGATARLGLAAFTTVVVMGLHLALAQTSAQASIDVLAQARSRLVTAHLRARWSAQAESRDGALQDGVGNLAQAVSVTMNFSIEVVNSLSLMVALLAAAMIVEPVMTATLLVGLVAVVLVLVPVLRFARHHSQLAVEDVASFGEEMAATSLLAKEIRAFGVTERQLELLEAANRAGAHQMVKGRRSARLASFWFKDLALLVVILAVAVMAQLVDLGAASTTAALLIVIRALGYAQMAYNAFLITVESGPAVDELVTRIRRLEAEAEDLGGQEVDELGPIRFDRVSYVYPDGRPALDDVSLDFPPGRVIAVVGRSGAGKTTLAELLLRLREPTSGSVMAGGRSLTDIRSDHWARLVAFVPQDPQMGRRSVYDNIRFLRPGFGDDEVLAAARLAHVADDLERLPDGLDTVLGPQSRGLSGGQRQRVAIARALLGGPHLLVLDEPTSALDRHSEHLLQQTLRTLKGQVTMVVIAHRLSTIDVCDDIVVLEDGRVTAFGPRDQVLETDAFFRSLAEEDAQDGFPIVETPDLPLAEAAGAQSPHASHEGHRP